jgi:beta-lactamase class A
MQGLYKVHRSINNQWIGFLILLNITLTSCVTSPAVSTPIPTQAPTPTQTPTPMPASATPPPTATATPIIIDYRPLSGAIQEYLNDAGLGPEFDMAVGFVDIETGQIFSFDGETRHYALSTFKGPLAAFYLWLIEHDQLEPLPSDESHLIPMLAESSNPDTSCVLKRVGGLAPFNDWLAEQGLDRQNNFIASWQSWACIDDGQGVILPPDLRYIQGDQALGLPGNYALFRCYPTYRSCDKAFAPLELAQFYARLYRGEVLNEDHTAQWLDWMKKDRDDAALSSDLPAAVQVRAYVKNGFRHSDEGAPIHFYHEAGIIETPYGVYALAVFTQGNPSWPASKPLAAVGYIVYDYFVAAHPKP